VLDQSRIDDFKKGKIRDIVGCYQLLRQPSPDAQELVKKSEEELDRMYRELSEKARSKLGIPKL
jgi:hypothetical protein